MEEEWRYICEQEKAEEFPAYKEKNAVIEENVI